MFGFIKDAFEAPFKAIGNLVEGDFEAFLMQPLEDLVDINFLGLSVGDIAVFLDDFLDANPWLKQIIVSVAPMYGSIAIAAIDILSEVEEGTFDFSDIARVGAEGVGLLVASKVGAGAGGVSALGTTTGQAQLSTIALARSGLLGEEASAYIESFGSALGGDWSSTAGSIQSTVMALQKSGVLGEDANEVLSAIAIAAGEDYSSVQSGLAALANTSTRSGLITGDAAKYIRAAGETVNGDYSNGLNALNTVADGVQLSGLAGEEANSWIDLGQRASTTDFDDSNEIGALIDGVQDTGVLGDDIDQWVDIGQTAATSDFEDPEDIIEIGESVTDAVIDLPPDAKTALNITGDIVLEVLEDDNAPSNINEDLSISDEEANERR